MKLITEHTGDTGSGKTYTLLTYPGRKAVIDCDGQMYIYLPDAEAYPLAVMGRAFPDAALSAGDPAVWPTDDPAALTPSAIREFVAAAGLGVGDTLGFDPWSNIWDVIVQSIDAVDLFTRDKHRKPNWAQKKQPIIRLLHELRALPCHVVLTTREKAEWGKDDNGKEAPTGKMISAGEARKTPYETPFRFRHELNQLTGAVKMTCIKQKSPPSRQYFRVGQSWDNPNMSEILTASGLLDAVGQAPAMPDPDAVAERVVKTLGGGEAVNAPLVEQLIEKVNAAADFEALVRTQEFLRDANKTGPDGMARIKAAVAERRG